MEHGEDRELRELLREWSVPDAPPSLDQRVLGSRQSGREAWWRFLLTGSIRIPVPVGMAFAAVLLVTIGGLIRQRPAPAPAPSTVSLVDFRPVSDLNVRVIRKHESN
jgi:hypothetical protein